MNHSSSKNASRMLTRRIQTQKPILKWATEPAAISFDDYRQRRETLMANLKDSAIVVPGYGLRYMSPGIFYPFRQATNMSYLTGFDEPDCALVLKQTNVLETILFVRPKDPHTEMWDGFRHGLQGAQEIYGADKAFPISRLQGYLSELFASSKLKAVYSDLPLDPQPTSILDGTFIKTNDRAHATNQDRIDSSWSKFTFNLFGKAPSLKSLSSVIERQRLFKSDSELKCMREAGAMTGRAIVKAMQATRAGVSESQIYAILDYECRMQGATRLSYVPVIAGGKNGLTLHYVVNNCTLKQGDLLLVDVGCEVKGYTADISRTWPVSGNFSEPQRLVYEAVLRVQKHIINKCTADSQTSLNALQNETFNMLHQECAKLFGRKVSSSEMNALYPHHVGHWLGMDLHDTNSVSRNEILKPGMVVTVEPGLYIPDEPQYGAFRGIAIRIEDDIQVGATSNVILSAEAPKEVADIEAIMSGFPINNQDMLSDK